MDNAFYHVLNMSITAAIIGLPVLVLRRLKVVSRFSIYIFWHLVFVRMIFPYSFSSEASIFNFTGNLLKKVVSVPTPLQNRPYLTFSNVIGAADSYFPITYKTNSLENLFKGAAFVWSIGAVAALMISFILYYITRKELRKAELISTNLYKSQSVSTPIVSGLFKQRIIISSELAGDEPELKYVLLHERVHIKRYDNLKRTAAIFTACIHWFNPFAWLYLRFFLNDMELACDERAVKPLSDHERKKYARALVSFSAAQGVFMTTAFGNSGIKARVLNVISYKRYTFMAMVISILSIAAAILMLLTNPAK